MLRYGVGSIQRARLSLTVRTDGKPDEKLEVGGPGGTGLEGRVSGRDVTYVVDTSLAESLEHLAF